MCLSDITFLYINDFYRDGSMLLTLPQDGNLKGNGTLVSEDGNGLASAVLLLLTHGRR